MKKSAKSYLKSGRKELVTENYSKAKKAFTRAIKLDPENAMAYYARGIAGLEEGISGDANLDFEKALILDPDLGEAHLGRACYWANIKRVDQDMIDITDNYAKLQPGNPNTYYSRSRAYIAAGRLENAIEDLSTLINMDPNTFCCYYFERGRAYEQLCQYQEAISDFSQAISVDPELPWQFYHRGNCYLKILRLDLALADFCAATEMDKKRWVEDAQEELRNCWTSHVSY